MAFPEEIFRSYDIRGTVDQLSEELAREVGAATVRLTGAKTVVVGRDMRETSPAFAEAVIKGIVAAGAHAVDIGMCSTPMFNFAVANYDEHEAGVMVTASHNPPEYNGFKMSRGDAMPISGAEAKAEIEKGGALQPTAAEVRTFDVKAAYLEKLFAEVAMPSLANLKVVVDAGNGMGGVILRDLFARLDCVMVPMFFDPDGRFPNHEANPIKLETLNQLIVQVAKEGAQVGIALDGDADRVGFVDEQGRFVNGDLLLAVLASERLAEHSGGKIVWSPNATWAIRDAVEKGKGVSVWEKVGRTNIIKRMKAEGALFGGEVSAHYFYPEFGCLESTDFTILLVLKLLAESGKTLSELLAPFRVYAQSGEINFEVLNKDDALLALKMRYAPTAVSVSELDGIRIEFADWWFNIRKSNTEPLVRLNLEATSEALMVAKLAEIRDVLSKMTP